MLQILRKGEMLATAFAFPPDQSIFLLKLPLAFLTIVRDVLPGWIIEYGFATGTTRFLQELLRFLFNRKPGRWICRFFSCEQRFQPVEQ